MSNKTPNPQTEPSPQNNYGATDLAKDAAKDTANVAVAAAKGAAEGGFYGAVIQGGIQLGKTVLENMKTAEGRKRTIVVGIVLMLVPVLNVANTLFISSLLIYSLAGAPDGQESISRAAFVNNTSLSEAQFKTVVRVENEEHVPWQILAAILSRNENGSPVDATPTFGGKTTGPITECAPGDPQKEKGLTDAALYLYRCGHEGFPDVKTIHGIGNRGGVGGGDHENGRAIDFMVNDGRKWDSAQAKQLGKSIVQWALGNAKTFNIKYVIYYNQIWLVNPDGTFRQQNYKLPARAGSSDTAKHMDHVHISVRGPVNKKAQLSGPATSVNPFKQSPGAQPANYNSGSASIIPAGYVSQKNNDNTNNGTQPDSNKTEDGVSVGEGRGPYGFNNQVKRLVPDRVTDDFLAASRTVAYFLRNGGGYNHNPHIFTLTCETITNSQGVYMTMDTPENDSCVKKRGDALIKNLQALPLVGIDKKKAEKIYENAFAWMLGRDYTPQCSEYPPAIPQEPDKKQQAEEKAVDKATGTKTHKKGESSDSPESKLSVGWIVKAKGGKGETFKMNQTQVDNATAIIRAAQKNGATREEQIMAIMTAIVETHLTNLPGGDRDSLGLFQQRPSTGWGTKDQIMNVEYATKAFLGMVGPRVGQGYRINKKAQRATTLGAKCQAVQGSAYPYKYAWWEQAATMIVDAVGGGVTEGCGVDSLGATGAMPGTVVSKTGWTYPLKQFRRITSGYGPRNISYGSRWHRGVDIGAHSGEVVLAAKAGEVAAIGMVEGAGNTITINHKDGHWSVYKHLSKYAAGIKVGDKVVAGQPIAYVGGTCGRRCSPYAPHLHFEIGIRGPANSHTIISYASPPLINPIEWMAANGVDLKTGKVTGVKTVGETSDGKPAPHGAKKKTGK